MVVREGRRFPLMSAAGPEAAKAASPKAAEAASPKAAAAPPPAAPAAVGTAVGQEVTVKMKVSAGQNKTRRGRLWCIERETGVLVLDCPDASSTVGNTMLRLIRVSNVAPKGFKVMEKGERDLATLKSDHEPKLEPVDPAVLEQRYKDAVARMQKRVAQIGRGVSGEAQHIFDNLSKTLDCQWVNKTTIRVNQLGVKIAPPYRPENCRGNDKKALARVKMMVKKFIGDWKQERIAAGGADA